MTSSGEQTGRTLGGTSYTLAWDYDGQLTSITQGSNVTSFVYDALGRRFSRTAGGTTTSFLSAGDAVLLEKQGTTTTATYTYGNALLRKDGEYPLFDGLGSARSETNGSQTVTATLTPDAFGQTVATTGSTTSKYGYAATSGYRTDGDAGLMHVGARYYDPQVGRFASRDTVLTEQAYLYCEHDPVNALDPSGHNKDDVDTQPLIWAGTTTMGVGWFVGQRCPPAGVVIAGIGAFIGSIGAGVKLGYWIGDQFWPSGADLELPPATPGEIRPPRPKVLPRAERMCSEHYFKYGY